MVSTEVCLKKAVLLPEQEHTGLILTEEEAFSLLSLCMTSPNKLDITSERALRKLADYAAGLEPCEGSQP
jgi:hypothetical protein